MYKKIKTKFFQMIADDFIRQLAAIDNKEDFFKVYRAALSFDEHVKEHHEIYLK